MAPPTTTQLRTSVTSGTTAARTAATHGRQLDVVAREIELRGLDGAAFTLAAPEGSARVELRLPGLYNVYNALGAGSLALTLGATLDEVVTGLEGFSAAFGRFERIRIGDRGLLMLLVKNPAGRTRPCARSWKGASTGPQ